MGAQGWGSLNPVWRVMGVGRSKRCRVRRGDVDPHLKRQVGNVGKDEETEKRLLCVGVGTVGGKLQVGQPGWCGAGQRVTEEARGGT